MSTNMDDSMDSVPDKEIVQAAVTVVGLSWNARKEVAVQCTGGVGAYPTC